MLSDATCHAGQNEFECHLGNTKVCTCCGEIPGPVGLTSTLRANIRAELTGVSKCRTAWHRPNRGYRCSMPNAITKNNCKNCCETFCFNYLGGQSVLYRDEGYYHRNGSVYEPRKCCRAKIARRSMQGLAAAVLVERAKCSVVEVRTRPRANPDGLSPHLHTSAFAIHTTLTPL